MKLVSWNILHGAAIPPLPSAISAPDSSGLHNASLILKELGIEVLGLQEVDHRQQRSGDSAQLAIIAKSLASEYWAYAPTLIGTPGEAWRSLATTNTYPAWGPKIQFDYITAHLPTFGEREISTIEIPPLGISDHLPLGVEIF